MRLINSNNSKLNGNFTFPRTIPLLIILSLLLLAAALPSGQASPQERHGWPVKCPPTDKAGEWSADVHFPSASVPLSVDDNRRVIPVLINTANSGRYRFSIHRTSGNRSTKFQVSVFHDVVRNFIQTTPRPPEWKQIVPYTRSSTGFGGKEAFDVPPYFSEVSKSGVAQVWVALMIFPDDQATPSSYKIWYTADQCFAGDGQQPRSDPGGCSWREITLLGQPQGWECICGGNRADPSRCGPQPR